MQIYMRVCPICANENIKNAYSKLIVPGWEHAYIDEAAADTVCLRHQYQPLIKVSMTCEEFKILRQISNEPSFMQAMNDLKERDIIEYNLKMSQFRIQVEQLQIRRIQNDSTPQCPNCGSTNINPISGLNRGASIAMWGAFSKKINKSYECKHCGYTW